VWTRKARPVGMRLTGDGTPPPTGSDCAQKVKEPARNSGKFASSHENMCGN
jgi:hypothetical protein